MSYSRTNNASQAEIYKSSGIYAQGTFKNVWKGYYTVGPRAGQWCVAKEFKTGSVFEDHYFQEELAIIRRTQQIINDWHAARVIDARIIVNTPAIWKYAGSGHKTLVEPMIQNFTKFNSNSGWTPKNAGEWGEAMQALSHFSYHNSGGQFLLCDLQGGVFSGGYVLSDPVIMSQSHNCGPADLGPDGIRAFFQRHRCGRFCKAHWRLPAAVQGAKQRVPLRQGTMMVPRSRNIQMSTSNRSIVVPSSTRRSRYTTLTRIRE